VSDELADERITARHSIHRQDLRTGVCQHPGCAHSAAASMSELPSPDELAEPMFVRNMRRLAQGEQLHDPALSARLLLTEFDRRGAEIVRLKADNVKYAADFVMIGATIGRQRDIVEAATALVESARPGPGDPFWGKTWSGYEPNVCSQKALDALAAAVHGETK
jgi:hypothetical protein